QPLILVLTALEQPEPSSTKEKGKRAYINCKATGLSDGSYIHWYRQKDGEGLKRILYVDKLGSTPVRDSEEKDFTVQLQGGNNYALKVNEVKSTHSGVYYCACWDSSSHSETNCSHPVQ
uniref:Ig-like domain-containing protein n=1 Tax=Pygocentrus nattereri TaxID=42514 RepID=A0A3B4EK98_PYGNA